MEQQETAIRNYFSAQGIEHFDDIVRLRKLGTVANIKAIGGMLQDLAQQAELNHLQSEQLILQAKTVCNFFAELRGKSSKAILAAIQIMTKGLMDYQGKDIQSTADFLRQALPRYNRLAETWMESITEYCGNVIETMETVLLFDYSSTAALVLAAAHQRHKKLNVFIPSSGAVDGGKQFVMDALQFGHSPTYFPDAAMPGFIKKSDAVFIGAETIFPDGSATNSVGSDMAAMLSRLLDKPLYVSTAMIKFDSAGIKGHAKKEQTKDLSEVIASDWPQELRAKTNFVSPKLVVVEARYITAFITELGVIPPTAMFGVGSRYSSNMEE